MQTQLACLQAEKQAALTKVKRLQSQQTTSTSFVQRNAADVQNTATPAGNQNNQLATLIDSQLGEIQVPIRVAQGTAQENFLRIYSNINHLYN